MFGSSDHGAQADLYGEMRPSPERMISEDGEYVAGWFSSFDGIINPSASRVRFAPFQCWLHVQFVTPEYLVVANIANLGLGGNTTVLVVDRRSGDVIHAAQTPLLWQNRIGADPDYRVFDDPSTGSRLSLNDGLGELFVDMRVGDLALQGTAVAIFDRPLIQTTAYGRGRGTLQWWGCVEVKEMTLHIKGEQYAIPAGSMGLYDRTVGHRRRRQNWNWLASIGEAADGTRFAIQASQDRPRALPYRWIHKAGIWWNGELVKASPGARFLYEPSEAAEKPWRVHLGEGASPCASLVFEPRFRREERKRIPGVLNAKFKQFYGTLSGSVEIPGISERLEVRDVFTVAEDSRLELL